MKRPMEMKPSNRMGIEEPTVEPLKHQSAWTVAVRSGIPAGEGEAIEVGAGTTSPPQTSTESAIIFGMFSVPKRAGVSECARIQTGQQRDRATVLRVHGEHCSCLAERIRAYYRQYGNFENRVERSVLRTIRFRAANSKPRENIAKGTWCQSSFC